MQPLNGDQVLCPICQNDYWLPTYDAVRMA